MMEITFEEYKRKNKSWMLDWQSRSWVIQEEKENEFITKNNENNYQKKYIYSENLTKKMNRTFPNGKMVIRIRDLGFKGVLEKELFHFYYDFNGELRVAIVVIEAKEPNKMEVRTLKANGYWLPATSFVKEEEKKEIENKFAEKIKNLKEYRLHYLFE